MADFHTLWNVGSFHGSILYKQKCMWGRKLRSCKDITIEKVMCFTIRTKWTWKILLKLGKKNKIQIFRKSASFTSETKMKWLEYSSWGSRWKAYAKFWKVLWKNYNSSLSYKVLEELPFLMISNHEHRGGHYKREAATSVLLPYNASTARRIKSIYWKFQIPRRASRSGDEGLFFFVKGICIQRNVFITKTKQKHRKDLYPPKRLKQLKIRPWILSNSSLVWH